MLPSARCSIALVLLAAASPFVLRAQAPAAQLSPPSEPPRRPTPGTIAGEHTGTRELSASIRRLDGSTLPAGSADALVRRLIAEHAIAGLQVAVVNDGRLAWSAAYGVRACGDGAGSAPVGPDGRASDLPMTRTTTTWAASITKAVFATYVMQLVEQGRFDLDAPIAAQLPQPLDAYPAYRETAAALVHDPA